MALVTVMSIYAPDIVSFDIEPPLQHVGAEAREHTGGALKNGNKTERWSRSTPREERMGITAVHKAPGDYPSGKTGDVLTLEFTVLGQHFVGLNGGPEFTFDEAVSFQVFTDTQEETDRYWNAIVGGGGQENVCGWCKDRFGLSWQIDHSRGLFVSADRHCLVRADPVGSSHARWSYVVMKAVQFVTTCALRTVVSQATKAGHGRRYAIDGRSIMASGLWCHCPPWPGSTAA